ncbi:MAG TPA: cytochrome-c peroxidase [Bacteroidetes bacterium]|nr:cytochrome-c peroxidase [Bacteroidota bacterium]
MRLSWFIIPLLMGSCSLEEANSPYPFPETPFGEVPQPERNQASAKGVELGKKLFFDTRLSKNGSVSCATCHHADKAFSDGIALTEAGVSGKKLLRHAPALFNLAWYEGLFWDGGSKNLESQVFGPLMHPDEMGMDLGELVKKLQADSEYPALFKGVWGTDSITSQRFAHAIAQYERTLISYHSPYDNWKAGEGALSEPELRGYAVYQTFCSRCHTEGLFTDLSHHANGIDSQITTPGFELMYMGHYRITLDSSDIGKFKTPSLRNLGFTAPYMHDGRFVELDEVLDHYFKEHRNNSLADEILKTNAYMEVSQQQKNDLKAFLYALNDTTFVKQQP